MKPEKLAELFQQHSDKEFLAFDRIERSRRRATRPDVHAFILLDALCPSKNKEDMIVSSEHDQYWLSVTPEQLARVATEDHVIELLRCGVNYDEDIESFSLFT